MEQEPRRIGLLGGTFDPPHEGHLWMALRARTLLDLDEVWFLPASLPPHKDPGSLSAYAHRLAMLRLLLRDREGLSVDESEKDKGGTSYTIDLLHYLKTKHGETLRFVLLIGQDSLADMDGWKDPQALFQEVEVAVLAREGFAAAGDHPCRVLVGETHPAQSRKIRRDLATGKLPRWLPDSIADYIAQHGLYGSELDRTGRDSCEGNTP